MAVDLFFAGFVSLKAYSLALTDSSGQIVTHSDKDTRVNK